MTQEFHISVTPIGGDQYLVRTERVAPGVPLAEEQVTWAIEDWLAQASTLMNDPLTGFLRGDNLDAIAHFGSVNPPGKETTAQLLPTNLVSVGQQLYNALFQGTIRDSWMTARGISQHLRQVLRLRLGLKDGRLPRLPWEVMYAGDRPLATGTDILFSRYHSSFSALTSLSQFQQIPAVNPQQPLRILMVLAAPTDQEVLALRQEAYHLQEELQQAFYLGNRAGSGIELTILDQPGREQLTQALEHNYYQIFHYAGHSNLGTAGGNLYLVNNKTGLTEMLNGDDLAGLLVNNGIRMAVFNSCRGVYTAAADSGNEGNLAEALVRRGVPAVLAMAERIPDDVALNLSRLFYRNLKQGYPIDLSLNRARQGLISSYGSNQLYWALPILYLHPQFDGYMQVLNQSDDRPALSLEDLDSGDLIEPLVTPANLATAAATDDSGFATGSDWLTPVEVAAEAAIAAGLDADALEFDDHLAADLTALDANGLEFDDPGYTGDWETVALMVNQLSSTELDEGDRPLAIDATENLLPNVDVTAHPSYPLPLTDRSATAATDKINDTTLSTPSVTVDSSDPELYQELEQLLVDAGKSTTAITACLRAIQQQPTNAEAYHQLGNALADQGYLAEAIAVYQQAIRLNPNADVYHHLGNALFQQGNLAEAIQAFNRAIQIDPNLSEPYEKLGHALRRQNQLAAAANSTARTTELDRDRLAHDQPTSGWQLPPAEAAALPYDQATSEYLPRYGSTYLARQRSPWLWAGAGAASVALVLFGGWFAQQHLGSKPLIPGFELPQKTNAERLAQLSTSEVTAIAIERLSQGDVLGGQQAVEALLDRRALSAAEKAMETVQVKQIEDPIILFLKGRLAWQSSTQNNNRDYSLEDARRFWETAAKQRPSPLAQNALGFVYYTDGKLDPAGKAWFRTIELLGLQTDTKTKILPKEALTAYAGIALNLMKTAETLPAERRAGMYAEAIRLRQKVLTAAPADFTPAALAKDWLWSETAIADWRTLLAL